MLNFPEGNIYWAAYWLKHHFLVSCLTDEGINIGSVAVNREKSDPDSWYFICNLTNIYDLITKGKQFGMNVECC